MRNIIHIVLVNILAWALSSCQDHFDINQLDDNQQLLVYCFPSDIDSTDIQVSATMPFSNICEMPKGINIHCYVNGKEETARYLRNDDSDEWDKFIYRLSVIPKEGDEIKIVVETENLGSASCSTTIPSSPTIDSISARPIQIDGDKYQQICIDMKNLKGEKSYYAVKVYGSWDKKNWGLCDTNTYSEPLLNNYIMGIPAFNEDRNFYDGFYIFENSSILNDSAYTLHLNIEENRGYYKVLLYHISEPMYAFFKTINDQANNEFGKYGLSFIHPTYSNIKNGCGVMAGYTVDEKIYEIKENNEE